MGIGSSKGAFYHDEFHEEAAPWMIHPKDEDSKDNNVIDPEVDPKGTTPLDNPVLLVAMKEPFSKDQMPRLEPGGIGGVEIRTGSQMRRPANDNTEGLYNPRESNMIGSKVQDDLINRSWKNLADQQKGIDTKPLQDSLKKHFEETVTKPHEEFIKKYDDLVKFREDVLLKKGGWTELNVARYNKMGKSMDTDWTSVNTDPFK